MGWMRGIQPCSQWQLEQPNHIALLVLLHRTALGAGERVLHVVNYVFRRIVETATPLVSTATRGRFLLWKRNCRPTRNLMSDHECFL